MFLNVNCIHDLLLKKSGVNYFANKKCLYYIKYSYLFSYFSESYAFAPKFDFDPNFYCIKQKLLNYNTSLINVLFIYISLIRITFKNIN